MKKTAAGLAALCASLAMSAAGPALAHGHAPVVDRTAQFSYGPDVRPGAMQQAYVTLPMRDSGEFGPASLRAIHGENVVRNIGGRDLALWNAENGRMFAVPASALRNLDVRPGDRLEFQTAKVPGSVFVVNKTAMLEMVGNAIVIRTFATGIAVRGHTGRTQFLGLTPHEIRMLRLRTGSLIDLKLAQQQGYGYDYRIKRVQ